MTDLSVTPEIPDKEPTEKEIHLMDVYAALGVEWGHDPFTVIDALRGDQTIVDSLPEILAYCRQSGNVVGLVNWLRRPSRTSESVPREELK